MAFDGLGPPGAGLNPETILPYTMPIINYWPLLSSLAKGYRDNIFSVKQQSVCNKQWCNNKIQTSQPIDVDAQSEVELISIQRRCKLSGLIGGRVMHLEDEKTYSHNSSSADSMTRDRPRSSIKKRPKTDSQRENSERDPAYLQ